MSNPSKPTLSQHGVKVLCLLGCQGFTNTKMPAGYWVWLCTKSEEKCIIKNMGHSTYCISLLQRHFWRVTTVQIFGDVFQTTVTSQESVAHDISDYYEDKKGIQLDAEQYSLVYSKVSTYIIKDFVRIPSSVYLILYLHKNIFTL